MGIISLDWEDIISWANKFYSQIVVEWVDDPTERIVFVHGNRVKDPTKYKLPITYQQCTLLDYELQVIRYVSQEYASEYSQASDPKRLCPKEIITEEVDEDTAMIESMRLKEALLNMFGKTE